MLTNTWRRPGHPSIHRVKVPDAYHTWYEYYVKNSKLAVAAGSGSEYRRFERRFGLRTLAVVV